MISLIRNCNGKKEVEKIRRFVKHQNTEVRIEALRTLLSFGTPDAVPYLKTCLQSEEPGMQQGAIKLAGNFRVRETVPHLIELVAKRDLFGAGALYKKDIVRSLGEIGDSQAIEALLKIYRTWSLFNQKNLQELKVEIFRNLQNYSPEAVRRLIDVGRSSKNEEIRSLCEKGLRRG
jgi:HEAT repeat protein